MPTPECLLSKPVINRSNGWVALLIVLTIAIAYNGFHTSRTAHHLTEVSKLYDRSESLGLPPAPVIQRAYAVDTYLWNALATEWDSTSFAGIRFTHTDNAPDGRPVYWNPGYTGYLHLLGLLRQTTHPDEPLLNAVFTASLWSNFLLLAVGMVVAACFCYRWSGALSASILVIAMALTPSFYEVFLPGYADHHGPLLLLLLGLAGGLLAAGLGWRATDCASENAPPGRRPYRQAMLVSAVCGAAAMSFSALSTAFFLTSAGVASVLTLVITCRRRHAGAESFDPGLWRLWGTAGATASLILYAVLFLPYAGWHRLEINHPLYALGWWGGAELTACLGTWLTGQDSTRKIVLVRCVPALCAVALLPAALLVFGGSVHVAGDRFHAVIATHILELEPVIQRLTEGTLDWRTAWGPLPILIILSAILLFVTRNKPIAGRCSLLYLLSMLAVLFLAQVYQTRWGVLQAPVGVLLTTLLLPMAMHIARTSRRPKILTCLCLAMTCAVAVVGADRSAWRDIARYSSDRGARTLSFQEIYPILLRDIATTLRADARGNQPVILASPTSSLLLATLSGGHTLGTLFWENTQGLRKAAKILCAPDAATTHALLRKAGVTHVVLIQDDTFLDQYRAALLADGSSSLPATRALWPYQALAQQQIPQWADSVPYPENAFTRALGRKVLILKVR